MIKSTAPIYQHQSYSAAHCPQTPFSFLFSLTLSLPLIFCFHFPSTENFEITGYMCKVTHFTIPTDKQTQNVCAVFTPVTTTCVHFCTSLRVMTLIFAAWFFREQASCYSRRCPDLKLDPLVGVDVCSSTSMVFKLYLKRCALHHRPLLQLLL